MMTLGFLLAFAASKATPAPTPVPIYPVSFPHARGDPLYNEAFKVSFDGVKITSNAPPNPNAPIENALKNDTSMWEAHWKQGFYFLITFPKPVEFSKFVFQARGNVENRGFPKRYKLFIKKDGEKEFEMIKDSYFTKKTGDPVVIDLNGTLTDIIEFKMQYDEIYQTLGNYMVSLIYLGFYNDDDGYELKDTVFVDGTYSKFQPGFDYKAYQAEIKTFNKYVQKYFELQTEFNKAMEEVSNTYPEMLEKDIYEFDCLGDLYTEQSLLKLATVHQSYMPLGRYLRAKETMELYCDFGNNTKFPIVRWLKHMDWQGEEGTHADLKNGYNKIRAPSFVNGSSQVMYPMYHCGKIVGWKGFEHKHPRCRLKGGHRFPMYVLFKSNVQHYYDELVEYQKKVTNMRNLMFDDSYRSDMTCTVSDKHIFIGTATGAYKGFKQNMPLENAIVKLVKNYDQYPFVYSFYGGHSFIPKGRFFSRVEDNFINGVHAYDHPFFTVFNCQCLNKPDQTAVWSSVVYSTNQMTRETDNSWGYFHEWGHGMDNGEIAVIEMTNNYYSQALTRWVVKAGPEKYDQGIALFFNGFFGKRNISDAKWDGMNQMRQLELYFGPDTHGKGNRFVRGNQNYTGSGFTKPGVGQHRWIIALCNVTNTNLNDYFYNIGWFWWNANQTNNDVQKIQKIIESRYKRPDHPIWYMSTSVRKYIGRGTGEGKATFPNGVMPVINSIKFFPGASRTARLTLNNGDAAKIWYGYEIRKNGKVVAFQTNSNLPFTADDDGVEIVLIDLRLSPGKSIILHIKNFDKLNKVPKTNWKVENFKGATTWTLTEGKLEYIVDGNPKTSYRNGGGIRPNGFIFDLNGSVTFNGYSRVRRDDPYGNTNKYRLYISDNKENWTQINKPDENVYSTSGTKEEFYFFGKSWSAKYIKYESYSTVKGDTHCGLAEFSLLNGGFDYSTSPGTEYPKNTKPFPDISKKIDMDTFQPRQPSETDELYSHYPKIYDQPCFALYGSTKAVRKNKVFDRDAALYALDMVDKVVDLEIEDLSIVNSSKVITKQLIISENLMVEKGSRLFADKGSSIAFEFNCTVDLFVDPSMKESILEIGNMNPSSLPKTVSIYLDLPSGGYFNINIIKGNEDALRSIRDNDLLQLIPAATRTVFYNVKNGILSVGSEKDESPDSGKDGNKKGGAISTITTIIIVVVVVVVIALVVVGIVIFKKRYSYNDSASSDQLMI